MSKNIRTLLILAFLAALIVIAYKLTASQEKSSLSNNALSNFAIDDTASINKIILTDTYGGDGITLIRQEGGWGTENSACIQEHLVQTILKTIKRIQVKGPVPKNTIETINKNLAAHNKKVEIYQNGKLSKTWYIGNPTADHYGTYMLLKDPKLGKSPEPFIMFLPSMHGNLKTRFITDSREFACTEVFSYRPDNISSVSVSYPAESKKDFTIKALENETFALFNENGSVPFFDTANVRNYLLALKKIHFEHPNYTFNQAEIDSLKLASPQTIIEVELKSNESNRILCYRKKLDYEKLDLDGKPQIWDKDRLWVILNDGTLTLSQYYVFDKLLQDISVFAPK